MNGANIREPEVRQVTGPFQHAISALNSQKSTLTKQIQTSQENIQREQDLVKEREEKVEQINEALQVLQKEADRREHEV